MKRSACLIFNPVAGQGDADKDLATIESILKPEFDLDIQFTSKEVSGGELARQAVDRHAEIIGVGSLMYESRIKRSRKKRISFNRRNWNVPKFEIMNK